MRKARPLFLVLIAALLASSCVTPPPVDPAETTRTMPPQTAGTHGLIVIIHGAFGGADSWAAGVENAIREAYDTTGWDIVRVNWLELSSRYATAMSRGRRLGKDLGEQLASDTYSYETIHLIAASLGSHVAIGITRGYAGAFTSDRERAYLHATFLEPFGGRRWRFGCNADFADHYYTSRDPFPLTNRPLANAINFNVNALVPPDEDPVFWYFHDFPVLDYRATVGEFRPGFSLSPLAMEVSGIDPAILPEVFPPGEVRVIE